MVSASVRTMSFLSNQVVSTRQEVSSTNQTEDFASMMDKSINKARESEYEPEVKDEVETDEIHKESEVKESDFNEKTTESVEDEVKVEDIPEDEMLEEEPVDEKALEEILNVVASILNISIDELKASLEKLNMEGKDLLDGNNVTKLVMDLKNIETKFELLVHNDANESIKDIQKSISQLMENLKQNSEVDTEASNVNETLVVEMDIEKDVMQEEAVNDDVKVSATNEELASTMETANDSTGSSLANKDEKNFASDNKSDAPVNNAMNELANSVVNEIELALEERVDEVVATRIVREIAENVSVAIREKMTSLEMQLNPESLGKVTILLASEENGITAKITAETEMAKNAIEQQLTLLKENFDKQGLKVTDIEVTIASHGFEQNLDKEDNSREEGQKKNGGIRKSLLDEINGISTEEQPEEDIVMQTLGNTVSYLA